MVGILGAQIGLTLFAAGFWWLWAGMFYEASAIKQVVLSSLIGGLACFLPAVLFACLLRVLGRSIVTLLVSELFKLVLLVLFLWLAVNQYGPLSWLPLLVSYLLVLKSYWLALVWK